MDRESLCAPDVRIMCIPAAKMMIINTTLRYESHRLSLRPVAVEKYRRRQVVVVTATAMKRMIRSSLTSDPVAAIIVCRANCILLVATLKRNTK
jgi:hypothetical protein